MAGSMDVAMEYSRRDAREAIPASHHVRLFHALFSLGGMARICVRGLVALTCGSGRDSLLGSGGIALAAMSILAFQVASASLST